MAISPKIVKAIEEELKGLYEELKPINAEIERLQRFLATYKAEGDDGTRRPSDPSKVDYPFGGSLFEKLRYLEEENGRFWKSDDMKSKIKKIESKGEAEKTTNYFSQQIQQLMAKGKVVCVKYNRSRINSFFTTHPELVDKDYHSKGKHRIKPGHEPEDKYMHNLTDEQKDPGNMEWTIIKQ